MTTALVREAGGRLFRNSSVVLSLLFVVAGVSPASSDGRIGIGTVLGRAWLLRESFVFGSGSAAAVQVVFVVVVVGSTSCRCGCARRSFVS